MATLQHPPAEIKPGETADSNVYATVYRVLLGGMVVSTLLFAIGIVRALLHPSYVPLTPGWIRQHYHVSVVIHGLVAGDPTSIMLVATAVLILTPVSRVLFSIYAFAVDHDRKYVFLTSVVLLVMIVTVVLGIFGLQ